MKTRYVPGRVNRRMTRWLRRYGSGGGTYTRPRGTQYGVENVRCIADSEFDSLGFAVQRPSDPDGDRCWSPVVGRQCEVCGKEV